jgi:hypothetical protein
LKREREREKQKNIKQRRFEYTVEILKVLDEKERRPRDAARYISFEVEDEANI